MKEFVSLCLKKVPAEVILCCVYILDPLLCFRLNFLKLFGKMVGMNKLLILATAYSSDTKAFLVHFI